MARAVQIVQSGERAKEGMARAMAEFHAACVVGKSDDLEVIRQKAHDNLDAFFDHLASLYWQ